MRRQKSNEAHGRGPKEGNRIVMYAVFVATLALTVGSSNAQQVTGVPGSPSATTFDTPFSWTKQIASHFTGPNQLRRTQ